MDRVMVFDQEQGRSFDINMLAKQAMQAGAWLMQDMGGATATVVAGLAKTAPGGLSVGIGAGRIYALANTDTLAVAGGDLALDTTQIMQQGWVASQSLLLSTAGLAGGQSRWALIQAGFSQTDVIAPADPNGGVMNFYNSANPAVPLHGQGGSNNPLNNDRQGLCVVQVVYGTVAATGSEVPPSASAGFVGLYLIDLAFGQATVTIGQILTAGPSVGTGVPSNYPVAPFIAGLFQSHHSGNAGQAPKILAAELAPISSSNANAGLSAVYEWAGNPNTHVAGTAATSTTPPDLVWDTTNQMLWACTATGNAGAAVWTRITTSAKGRFEQQTAGTYTLVVPAGITQMLADGYGSGGGGGGTTSPGDGGSGAGGAEHRRGLLTVVQGETLTIVVGAGGAGGVGADGIDGADSTVTGSISGVIFRCKGGGRGRGSAGGGLSALNGVGGSGGTGGDLSDPGAPGSLAFLSPGVFFYTALGGTAFGGFSLPGVTTSGTPVTGQAARFVGGGGNGGGNGGAGGAGFAGRIELSWG